MIDHTTTLYLNVVSKDKKTAQLYLVTGMKMGDFPSTTVAQVTIRNNGIDEDVKFEPNRMFILKDPKESVIEIRIAQDKVLVTANKQLNHIEQLGIIELGKVQLIKGMFDMSNRMTMINN
jgi:hypothetical protein